MTKPDNVIPNAIFMLASQVSMRAATFAIYAMVSRMLGTREFGQLAIAFALFYFFRSLAAGGVKVLLVREVARKPEESAQYLTRALMFVVPTSIAGSLLMVAAGFLLPYDLDTLTVTIAIAPAVFGAGLSAVWEGMLQAHERMRWIAFATVPASVASAACAYLVLSGGGSVVGVAQVMSAVFVSIAAVQGILVFRHVARPQLEWKPREALALARGSSTFLGIDMVIAIWGGVGVLVLSSFVDEAAAGLYSAAMQLWVPAKLTVDNLAMSFFPAMCRESARKLGALRKLNGDLIELLLTLSIPSAIGLSIIAESALETVYGSEEFAAAALPLRIIAWSLVMSSLTTSLGKVLLAAGRETSTLRIVSINFAVELSLALALIPLWGIGGAAAAAALAATVNVAQHYVPVAKMIGPGSLFQVALRPAAASAAMVGVLLALEGSPLPLLILSGAVAYAVALAALMYWPNGSFTHLLVRYAYLKGA